jgi:transcription initiation factor TFIID subunit 12
MATPSNTQTTANQPQPANAASIIQALGNAFKSQTGEPMAADKIAQLLVANISQLGQLAKEGKLNQQQILQVCAGELRREYWAEVELTFWK